MSNELNEALATLYNAEEIKWALKQMHPAKAPGPDGMPPLFFQHFWNTIESSFLSTCLGLLNDNVNLEFLNHTYIVLIPKVKIPLP